MSTDEQNGQWGMFVLDADRYLKSKDEYAKWIEDTPLMNKLPVWIAEFVLEMMYVESKKKDKNK